jgi:hypothetical protein
VTYAGCKCWWAEPTDLCWRKLRVVEGETGSCPDSPWGHHYESIRLAGEHELNWTERDDYGRSYLGYFPKPTRGWPKKCRFCGTPFGREQSRYTDVDRLYLNADGTFVTLRGPNGEGGRGPAGMLTHSDWRPFGHQDDRYGDGINLVAVCPNGSIWHVDGPAYHDGRRTPNAWTRTGDPRHPETLNVSPSIVAGDYHGFLQNGYFTAGM